MTNAADTKQKRAMPAGFIPMSQGVEKLKVPEREGYHRRWFRGDAGRIARAQQAGYTFVDPADVELNNFDLGGDAKNSGNTDLGTRVSVISGDETGTDGQPHRLYLMECPEEFYEYSRSILADRNESIAEALRGGKIGDEELSAKDRKAKYVGEGVPDLFNPNKRR